MCSLIIDLLFLFLFIDDKSISATIVSIVFLAVDKDVSAFLVLPDSEL